MPPSGFSQINFARWAVAATFFVNGTLIGVWAANIPLVKEALGLDAQFLSYALFSAAFGALAGMPFGGKLIAKFGSARVTLISGLGALVTFPAAMLAPSYAVLLVVLVAAGFANGVMDVAMNAHGALVEQRISRPVMSSFHAAWSTGGLIGSGFVWLALNTLGTKLLVFGMAVVLLVAFLLAISRYLSSTLDQVADAAHFALPSRQTLALGSIAFLGMLSEGAVLDWSGVYLRELLASPSLAASGVAGFSGTMALSRFFGDGLRAKFGAASLVRGSAVISLAGLIVALFCAYGRRCRQHCAGDLWRSRTAKGGRVRRRHRLGANDGLCGVLAGPAADRVCSAADNPTVWSRAGWHCLCAYSGVLKFGGHLSAVTARNRKSGENIAMV